MFEALLGLLKTKDIRYDTDVLLADISPIRIGGPCPLVVWPSSKDELVCVVDWLENNGIGYKIVGRMTNLLVRDSGYSGAIIRTDRMCSWWTDKNSVYTECGITLPHLAKALAPLGITGIEQLSGIPGSIGGALVCNAGAYGCSISDVLKSVTVLDGRTGEMRTLGRADVSFAYRYSSLAEDGGVLLCAVLQLDYDDPECIRRRMADFANMRTSSQPCDMRSLGSTFKRPADGYASKMIDECGLKGQRIGGAEISDKHAGFIVNRGGATADDVARLMSLVSDRVYVRFGVVLEPEIEIL